MSRRFPPELEEYIRQLAPDHTTKEIIAELEQDWPEYPFTYMQLTHYCEKRGIARKPQHPRKYSDDLIEWIRKEAPGSSRSALRDRIKTELGISIDKVKFDKLMNYYGIKTGVDTKFEKGHQSWCKGMKGVHGANIGTYKKGNIPQNRMPVGSTRISPEGFHETKYEQPDKWMLTHRLMWIQAGRELQPNEILLFADGDRTNLSLDNFVKATRSEMGVMRMTRGMYNDASMTRCNLALAKLKIATKNLKKRKREENKDEID